MESGDPQIDFFHSRHEDARSTSLEFQFLRARLKEFFGGQVVKNSKNGFGYPVIWKIQWGNSSPPRSKSLPQYHSLVTSWNVVYFELQTLTKIYRGWLSDMATIKRELEVDQACKNEMLSETYGQKTEDQDTIIITKEFRSTSITTLFGSSDSFQTFNFCGKKTYKRETP